MKRGWCISLTAFALAFGSMLFAASASSAAPTARPVIHSATVRGFEPGGLMHRAHGVSPDLTHHGRFTTTTSTNWSGYAVTGSKGAFTSVSASWTEPAASCPSTAGGSGKNKGASDSYAAFWVGLDGYSSNSVEQTGTDSDCAGTTPQYYGWYEMYPAFPVNFTNTVEPGDAMSASVTFSGTKTYTLVLTDSTQGWTQTIVKDKNGLDRSSAEVITEAPSSGSGVLPLSDFGTVSYSASSANGTSLGAQNPVEIEMVDSSGADKDSTSSISSGGGFSNTWLRSN